MKNVIFPDRFKRKDREPTPGELSLALYAPPAEAQQKDLFPPPAITPEMRRKRYADAFIDELAETEKLPTSELMARHDAADVELQRRNRT